MKKILSGIVLIFFFLEASAQNNADTIRNWQVYLDDSLVLTDNLARLEVSRQPLLLILSRKNTQSSRYLIFQVNNCTRGVGRQQLFAATQDSTRLTQWYFKTGKRMKIPIKDLLAIVQKELYIYYHDGLKVMPGQKPYGDLIARFRIE